MKFESKHYTIAVVLSLVLTFMWFYPWQPWVGNLPWVRHIIGISLFLLPGVCIQFFLSDVRAGLRPHHITNGFVVSIMITGVLGMVARITALDFRFVSTGLYLAGVLALIAVVMSKRYPQRTGFQFHKKNVWVLLTALVLIAAGIIAAKISIPSLIYEDDFTYNALLYYYQHADSYTFQFDPALSRLEIARFWIAFWPLVEALLADLSEIDGLLITGIYIAPSLVALSMLAVYSLGRSLGFARGVALFATVAHIASLIRLTQKNQAGVVFFDYLTEDKVVAAFVLAPILFKLAMETLEEPTWRKLVLFTICATAFAFTHPVMLGFACLITGLTGLVSLLRTRRIKPYIMVLLVLVLILVIPFYIRIIEGSDVTEFTMTDSLDAGREHKLKPGRLTVLENEMFYGISPGLIKGLPYELLLIAGGIGIFSLKRQKVASLITAAVIVLVLSIYPYTGWIIGYLSSPFQLWRLTWLMPFGIAIAAIVDRGLSLYKLALNILPDRSVFRALRYKQNRKTLETLISFCLTLVIFGGTIYILPWAKGNLGFGGRKPGFELWYEDYIEIAGVLKYLDIDGDIIVGGPDRSTNDIIPSISQDVHLVSFRNERGGYTAPIWEAMVAENTPTLDRMNLYREYQLKYLLIRENPQWVDDLLDTHPDNFELIHANRKLRLFEFNP